MVTHRAVPTGLDGDDRFQAATRPHEDAKLEIRRIAAPRQIDREPSADKGICLTVINSAKACAVAFSEFLNPVSCSRQYAALMLLWAVETYRPKDN